MRLGLAGLAVLTGAAGVSCSDVPSIRTPTVRDSAGIAIVTTSAADLAALPEWTLADADVVLGSLGQGPAHQFSHVVDGFRLADGSILVGDQQTRELRLFSPTGEPLRTFGGQGEGPGELPFLHRVERGRADTILVSAWPFGVLSRFAPSGEYISGRRIGPFWPGQTSRVLTDGSLLLDYFERGFGNNVELWAVDGEEPTFRAHGVLIRAFEDERIDTLRAVFGREYFKTGTWRQDLWLGPLPFGSATLTAPGADRVFVGETDRPEIEVRSLDGTLETLIRWSEEPVPVREADRDRIARSELDRLRQPARAPHVQRWLAAVPYPEHKPPFLALYADRGGALWVRLPTDARDPRDRWIAFDPGGTALAEIRPPAGARFLDIAESFALLVRADELDVERVELRPLKRD